MIAATHGVTFPGRPNTRSGGHLSLRSAVIGTTIAVLVIGAGSVWGQAFTADEQAALTAAVEIVSPSVVRIQTVGGLERVEGERLGTGPSTGVIVRSDGLIVSSSYNFLGEPAGILVTLADGTKQAATIVARDRSRELVLLRIETDSPLPVPAAISRQEMRPGHWAIALGRTFDSDVPGISTGIVSAVDRIWGKAIQTDAKVSPINYGGPLIDLRGRVYGILVPMSPDASGATAGAEWYDSGIGFAIPFEDVLRRVDRLAEGVDLKPGLMGLTFKGGDIYADAAEILAVSPKGPAAAAGIKPGGRIVAAQGQPVARQAQIKHILGRLDAGDELALTVETTPSDAKQPGKDSTRRDVTIILADEIPPYVATWLGVLPVRVAPAVADDGDSEQPEDNDFRGENGGVGVEFVFPDSPAAKAGLAAGDRIVAVAGTPVGTADEARTALLASEPGEAIDVTIRSDVRQPAERTVAVTLAPLSVTTPDDLPNRAQVETIEPLPAGDQAAGDDATWVEVRLPESGHTADALLPPGHRVGGRSAMLVWLGLKPNGDRAEAEATWKSVAAARGIVIVFPRAEGEADWNPTQGPTIRQTTEEAIRQFGIDESRVGIGGQGTGGAMAGWLALTERELFRGLTVVDAPMPRQVQTAETEPGRPLLIRSVASQNGRLFDAAERAAKVLEEKKFPLQFVPVERDADAALSAQAAPILRLIDAIDRL